MFFFLSGCGRADRKKGITISGFSDLNHPQYTIGSMTGIVALREAQMQLPKARYREYSMPMDAFTALYAGKIDAVVLDRPTLEYMAQAHPEFSVMKQDLAVGHISVAAAKRSSALMEKVNDFIRLSRQDGTYSQMYNRWFHSANPQMPEISKPFSLKKAIRVGVTANNDPMCFIQNGKLAGFDTEFALRLGAFLKRKIEFKDISYDALPAALESGKIDLAIAQMDAVPERMETLLFSDNYIDSPITILLSEKLSPKKSAGKIASFRDLNDPRFVIACQSEILATKETKKRLPRARYMEFSSSMDCCLALRSGKADAFVYDRPALEYAALDDPGFYVLPENIAVGHISVAAVPNKKELICRVNNWIRHYRSDGTYKDMYRRWLLSPGAQMPQIPKATTPREKLVIGITADNPPLSFVSDKKFTGFDVEFTYRMAQFLQCDVEFMNLVYDGLIPALHGGKIDLAVAQMDATPERKEKVLFSEEYIDSPVAMMILRQNAVSTSPPPNAPDAEEPGLQAYLLDTLHSLQSSFEKTFIREARWKLILQGLGVTLLITVFSVLLGTMLAFPVCMICRSQNRILSWFGERYVSLILGTPILVILMILYYVIFAKVDLPAVLVAIFAFALDFSANNSVTLRSGIDGIPKGQMEAALALGYRPTAAFCRFILPQAVQTVLPVYRTEIINTLKSTSIVGYIAIMDLTKMGDIIRSRTYEAFFPLISIALLYFLAAKGMTLLLLQLEKRLDPVRHRNTLQKRGTK